MFKYTKNLYKIFVITTVVAQACVIGTHIGARTIKKIEKNLKKIMIQDYQFLNLWKSIIYQNQLLLKLQKNLDVNQEKKLLINYNL